MPLSVIRETLLVARYELGALFTSIRAALFFVVYAFAAGVSGWMAIALNDKLKESAQEVPIDLFASMEKLTDVERTKILENLSERGLSGSTLEVLISGRLPPLVVWILFTTTFVLPALVVLVGFTGIGEDLESKFSRYVFQRVHRGSWLAGKVLAHFAVSIAGIMLVHLALLGLASTREGLSLEPIARVLPMIWASMAILTLGYVAYTALFAANLGPPFKALALSWFLLMGLWFTAKITPLDRVWLGSLDARLWMLEPSAIAIALAHVAAFLGLAWLGLKRRDV